MAAHIDAFAINGVLFRLTDDQYTEERGFYDYTKQTEAGTTRRDVVRLGYLKSLSIRITGDDTKKQTLETAAKEASLTVTIYSDNLGHSTTWNCYMSDLTADLIRDTPTEILWSLSFTLNDLEAS